MNAVIPLFVSLSLMSVISLVDIFLAGLLGPEAQAALGIADQIVFLNMLLINGFCAGVNALVSRAAGAGELLESNLYSKYSMVAAALIGIAATGIGFCFAETIASVFAAECAVRQQASIFIRLCALGNLPWALVMCQGAVFRARGQARLCIGQWLVVALLCTGIEVVAFFFISGCRSMVPLAVSWDFAIWIGYFFGSRSLGRLGYGNARFLPGQFISHARSVFAIGMPVALGDLCWLGSNLLLFSLLSHLPHPTCAQAAWTLQLKIEEAIAYVPLMACCQATATLVGNRLGSSDLAGARQSVIEVARVTVISMFVVGCLTALLSPYIVQLASTDLDVQRLAQQLLLGSIITFPITALALVLAAALEGAGATMMPMVVTAAGLLLLRLPLASLLALPLGLGVAGVWVAKCLSSLATAWGMALVFRRPDWSTESPPESRSAGYIRRISKWCRSSETLIFLGRGKSRETLCPIAPDGHP